MRILFCNNLSDPKNKSPENDFITDRASAILVKKLDTADDKLYEQFKIGVSGILAIVKFVLFIVGIITFPIRSLDLSDIHQHYNNAPALFWISGCSLVAFLLLWIVEKYLTKKKERSEEYKTAQKKVEDIELQIRRELRVLDNAREIEILCFSYNEKQGLPEIDDIALNRNTYIYKSSDGLCLFDGEKVFTIPQEDLIGLRIVEQGMPIAFWLKGESITNKHYKKCGAIMLSRDTPGLRFCCALDINDRGETVSILFPAYELPIVQKYTGLSAPLLPSSVQESNAGYTELVSGDKRRENRIRPEFYWKAPSGSVKRFFSLTSDFAFQARHPKAYIALEVIGIAALCFPMALFLLLGVIFHPVSENGWIYLGAAGSFIVGIGLFNIVAAWIHQYLGHIVTIGCIVIGGLMIAISWILIL